jgi:hypothetical protein
MWRHNLPVWILRDQPIENVDELRRRAKGTEHGSGQNDGALDAGGQTFGEARQERRSLA